MARIDSRTGRLFSEDEAIIDLAQAVEDAVLTVRGTRRYRSYYGTYALDFGRGIDVIIPSIYDSLRNVSGIRKIDVVDLGDTVKIIINDAIILDFGQDLPGGTLTWKSSPLQLYGEDITYHG